MSSSSHSSSHSQGSSSPQYSAPLPHTLPEYQPASEDLYSPIMSKYQPRSSWPPQSEHQAQAQASWPTAPPTHHIPIPEESPLMANATRPIPAARHSYPASASLAGGMGMGYPISLGASASADGEQQQQQPAWPIHGYPHFAPPLHPAYHHHGYFPPPMAPLASQPWSPRPKTKTPHPIGPILEPGEELATRPPFTFAALIGQALLEAPPPHQLYVSEIADSIKKRYAYYRQHPNKIYNGVRHQTSMCKAFIKLPRSFGDQSGGARRWAIRPGCESWFAGGGYSPPSASASASASDVASPPLRAAKSSSSRGKTKSSASLSATTPRIKMPILRLNVGLSRNSELSPPPEHSHSSHKESHPCAPNGAPLPSFSHAHAHPADTHSPSIESLHTPLQSYYPYGVPHLQQQQQQQPEHAVPAFPQEYMLQAPPYYPHPTHYYGNPYPYVLENDGMAPTNSIRHQWSYPQPSHVGSIRHLQDKQPETVKAPIDFSVSTGTPSPRSSARGSPALKRPESRVRV